MARMALTRRRLLARSTAVLSYCSLLAVVPRAARAAVCTPDYAGDKEQRDALHYAEASPDPAKTCENCQYFKGQGRCGNCRIFNSPVNPAGFCDSWSQKVD
jgi:hypothetical protein